MKKLEQNPYSQKTKQPKGKFIMYNPYSSTANNLNFYESCRIFLEKQIVECNDIELKKEFINLYNELIKSVSELEKTTIINNTDWNKTSNTNFTQANIAYNQNAHTTQQAYINVQGQALTEMVQNPQFIPPNNIGVNHINPNPFTIPHNY